MVLGFCGIASIGVWVDKSTVRVNVVEQAYAGHAVNLVSDRGYRYTAERTHKEATLLGDTSN